MDKKEKERVQSSFFFSSHTPCLAFSNSGGLPQTEAHDFFHLVVMSSVLHRKIDPMESTELLSASNGK
jgi:hypothetical protein